MEIWILCHPDYSGIYSQERGWDHQVSIDREDDQELGSGPHHLWEQNIDINII